MAQTTSVIFPPSKLQVKPQRVVAYTDYREGVPRCLSQWTVSPVSDPISASDSLGPHSVQIPANSPMKPPGFWYHPRRSLSSQTLPYFHLVKCVKSLWLLSGLSWTAAICISMDETGTRNLALSNAGNACLTCCYLCERHCCNLFGSHWIDFSNPNGRPVSFWMYAQKLTTTYVSVTLFLRTSDVAAV